MSVPAGKLNRVIDILVRRNKQDPTGQVRDEWEVHAEGVRAAVQFRSGTESRGRGEQQDAVATHEVTCRNVPGVTPARRGRVRKSRRSDVRRLGSESVGDAAGMGREVAMVCKRVA